MWNYKLMLNFEGCLCPITQFCNFTCEITKLLWQRLARQNARKITDFLNSLVAIWLPILTFWHWKFLYLFPKKCDRPVYVLALIIEEHFCGYEHSNLVFQYLHLTVETCFSFARFVSNFWIHFGHFLWAFFDNLVGGIDGCFFCCWSAITTTASLLAQLIFFCSTWTSKTKNPQN